MSDKIQVYRPSADLLSTMSTEDISRTAGALVRFAPGGRALGQAEAAQLAVYALMTDLNPFNNECYMMDKVGPTAGVAGYRRKAKEYNRIHGGGEYYVEFRPALSHEANFDPDKGDVAWVAILTDDNATGKWEKTLQKWVRLLLDAGMDAEKAWERAEVVAGKRPSWEAVGVVAGSEKFSGPEWEDWKTKKVKKDEDGKTIYKAEMWDRNLRAQKRAEKYALRQRYPDVLNVPEYNELTAQDLDMEVIIRDVVHEMENKKPLDEGKALAELGYENIEAGGQHPPVVVTGPAPVPPSSTTTIVDATLDPAWNVQENMTYEFASKETNSKGTPYVDLETSQLSAAFNNMQGRLKNKDLDPETRDKYERKCAAIEVILKKREEEGNAGSKAN